MENHDLSNFLQSIASSLSSIDQSLKSIAENLSGQIRSDQIRSDLNQSNQIESDQIRSDQISNNHSNWLAIFEKDLEFFGIDFSQVDLKSIQGGATYYLENKSKITAKASYLRKVLKTAQPASKPMATQQQPKKTKPEPDIPEEDLILGIDKNLVEEKAKLFDLEIFNMLLKVLPSNYKSFFTTFQDTNSSVMKKNIITAIGIKQGLF